MAKMKEGSKAFMKEAIEMLWSRHRIYSCQGCGHPVLEGFCCGWCGCDSPVNRNMQEPVPLN